MESGIDTGRSSGYGSQKYHAPAGSGVGTRKET
jgi:hypothetical protein